MSSVRFVLGAEADIATGDEVRAAVNDGTEAIGGMLKRGFNKDVGQRLRPIASQSVAAANGTGVTGTFVLDMGSPSPGCVWALSEVIVTGATDREAPAGAVASLWIGNPPYQVSPTTILGTPPLGNLVRPAVALPAVFLLAGEDWPVHDGDNLFAIVYSLTTAVTVVSAVATVKQVNASALSIDMLR